ncbi:MAG: hypothetical protein LBG83_07435 [Oscillospiraceae bacterium]|jgi:hypothetical protein|nr:hypothetical protein [Oscillospiraceae bacterium]
MADKKLTPDEKLKLKEDRQRQKEKERFERERKRWKRESADKRRRKAIPKLDTTALIVRIISIVVAAALVLGLGWVYASSYGIPMRYMTVLSVGSEKVSEPIWAYYFYGQYRTIAEQSMQFAQYGLSGLLGLDFSKSAFGQVKSGMGEEEDAPKQTWDEYFKQQTNENLHKMMAAYAQAKKDKFTLSENDKKKINDQMEKTRTDAQQYSMSISAFLRANYTPGLSEAKYRSLMEKELLVQNFEAKKQEELKSNYSAEKLRADYTKDPTAYDFVDFRVFGLPKETLSKEENETDDALKARQAETDAKTKAEAQNLLNASRSEQAFLDAVTKLNSGEENYDAASGTLHVRARFASLSETYSEDIAKAVFQLGQNEPALLESDSNFYVFYVLKPAYQIKSATYFMIPVEAPQDATATEEAAEQTKAKAEKLLADWKAGAATLETFKTLASENISQEMKDAYADVEPGEVPNAIPGAAGEENLDTWVFQMSRKAGDTVTLPVSQGYVVLYYVGQGSDWSWTIELTNLHVSEDYTAYLNQLTKENKLVQHGLGMKAALYSSKKMCDAMSAYLQQQIDDAKTAPTTSPLQAYGLDENGNPA